MTKNLKSFLLLLMAGMFGMLLCVLPVRAGQPHHTEDYVRHAVGVLKGVFFDYSQEEAIKILHEVAEQDSMPYAMNALGRAYLKGTGVKKNMREALHWLEEAGKHGIADAFHDVGAVYKEGRSGIRQDFAKAYDAFLQGARLGSKKCSYDAGYMLYKGLGCEQSYAKAIELFDVAVKKGNSAAMYMLGLCYRNGYGTEQDEDKAMEWLNKAADNGSTAAEEELAREYPENRLHKTLVASNDIKSIPETNGVVKDAAMLKGDYAGCLVVCDWSGEYLLKELPVEISVLRNGNEATGNIFIKGYGKIPFSAEVREDGMLKFKDSYAELKERYTKKGKVRYRLDYAKLDIWKDGAKGELSVYSLNHKEPEKPIYIHLNRSK